MYYKHLLIFNLDGIVAKSLNITLTDIRFTPQKWIQIAVMYAQDSMLEL